MCQQVRKWQTRSQRFTPQQAEATSDDFHMIASYNQPFQEELTVVSPLLSDGSGSFSQTHCWLFFFFLLGGRSETVWLLSTQRRCRFVEARTSTFTSICVRALCKLSWWCLAWEPSCWLYSDRSPRSRRGARAKARQARSTRVLLTLVSVLSQRWLGCGFEVITLSQLGYFVVKVQRLCSETWPYWPNHQNCTTKLSWSKCTVKEVVKTARPGSGGGNGWAVRTASVRKRAAMQAATTQVWKFALTVATVEACVPPPRLCTRTLNTHYTLIYKNTKALESRRIISHDSDYCLANVTWSTAAPPRQRWLNGRSHVKKKKKGIA